MAGSEEISLLARTIRSSMGEAAGEFRRAADSSHSMTRIVRDIANIFSAQRRDLAELQNTMSESAFEAEQSSSKLDHLSSLFREMISVQTSTLGELRDIDRGIREVDKELYSIRYVLNNQGSSLTGISNAVTAAGSEIVSKLATFAVGGLAGGAAVGAMGGFGGGSGGGGGGGGGGFTGSGGEGGKISNPVMAKDIYSYLTKEKGIDHAHAIGIVTNIDKESRFNSGSKVWDINGPSGGLFQHHDNYKTGDHRFTDMTKAAGPDWQKNWKGQIDFALSESVMQKYLKTQYQSGAEATAGFTNIFERPRQSHGEVAADRAKGASKFEKLVSGETTPKQESVQTSTQGGGESSALKPEEMGGHGHGPISGPLKDAEKMGGGAALPSGDIVALGKSLEKMGIRISEHPSFGGVHPEKHYPNSAHNDGMAIDINAPGGITEAQDPVWGPKFDQIAKQIQAAGYTVLWRTRGHDNHIHAQIGGKGIKGGQSVIGGAGGKEQSTDQPRAVGSDQSPQGATPVSASSPTTGMAPSTSTQSEAPSAPPPLASTPEGLSQLSPIAAAINQQAPAMMMNGMQGYGSMMAMLAPALQQIYSQNSQIFEQQPSNAEMTQQLSESSTKNQIITQTAVQQQAQQEIAQETAAKPEPTKEANPTTGGSVSRSGGNEAAFGYNNSSDTSWPDWAAMLGGWHFKEPQNIKKNMWS